MPERLTPAEERLIREFADANPRKSEIVFKLLDEINLLRAGLKNPTVATKLTMHVAAYGDSIKDTDHGQLCDCRVCVSLLDLVDVLKPYTGWVGSQRGPE